MLRSITWSYNVFGEAEGFFIEAKAGAEIVSIGHDRPNGTLTFWILENGNRRPERIPITVTFMQNFNFEPHMKYLKLLYSDMESKYHGHVVIGHPTVTK